MTTLVPLMLGLLSAGAGTEPRHLGNRTGVLNTAFNLGNISGPTSHADCVWRRGMDKDACPDPDVFFYLYTGLESRARQMVLLSEQDWLRHSGWDAGRENVLLVHGYAGGDQRPPMPMLREAYLRNGSYNVFYVDWGALVRPPCYPAAAHNVRPVARCTAALLTFLRAGGLPIERTTCVGHSLGAHVCGLLAGYLTFRMHRIIGLDPARPLIRPQNRLSPGDAGSVHVIHTNAGHYGDVGRMGHADFTVNGGRQQPYCEAKANPDLCSHLSSVCYLAESISTAAPRMGSPCRGPRQDRDRLGTPVVMGQHTPTSATGVYCVSNSDAPYCPQHPTCCIEPVPSLAITVL